MIILCSMSLIGKILRLCELLGYFLVLGGVTIWWPTSEMLRKTYIGVSTVGCRGFSPHLVVPSITLKNLLDHTFSDYRIAISGTSTVSASRFLETTYFKYTVL